jgi:hypothetical protein
VLVCVLIAPIAAVPTLEAADAVDPQIAELVSEIGNDDQDVASFVQRLDRLAAGDQDDDNVFLELVNEASDDVQVDALSSLSPAQVEDDVDEGVQEQWRVAPREACPVDPTRWGGPGKYCHVLELVYCRAPGVMPERVVAQCEDGCVITARGLNDECRKTEHKKGVMVMSEPPTPPSPVPLSNEMGLSFSAPPAMSPAFMQCLGVPPASAASYATGLTDTLRQFNIAEPMQIASFLGNCAVESAYWTTTVEIGNGSCTSYSGGCRYKGRGIIQITHDYLQECWRVLPSALPRQAGVGCAAAMGFPHRWMVLGDTGADQHLLQRHPLHLRLLCAAVCGG